MKKNILLVLLTVITAISVVYGIVQRSEAEKQREISVSLQQKLELVKRQAEQMQQEAERQREIAEQHAMMAAQVAREHASAGKN